MGELTGGLIEMNSRYVTGEMAMGMIWIGFTLAAIFFLIAVMTYIEHGWKKALVMLALAVGFAVVGGVALNKPKLKEIRCCVSGPISLESVAVKYDIVSVDGKELVLRERG